MPPKARVCQTVWPSHVVGLGIVPFSSSGPRRDRDTSYLNSAVYRVLLDAGGGGLKNVETGTRHVELHRPKGGTIYAVATHKCRVDWTAPN